MLLFGVQFFNHLFDDHHISYLAITCEMKNNKESCPLGSGNSNILESGTWGPEGVATPKMTS